MQSFRLLTFVGLLTLTSCFSSELKEIKLQAVTGHLVSLPITSDTISRFQITSDIWESNWETALQEASISEGQITEARPILAQASVFDSDSTFRGFDVLSFSIVEEPSLLSLAELDENESLSQQELPLFSTTENYRTQFFSASPQIQLEYLRNHPTDTIWTIELLVLWELKGEI